MLAPIKVCIITFHSSRPKQRAAELVVLQYIIGGNMGKAGGTQMYCPNCEKICVCRAIPLNEIGRKSGQRWRMSDHPDINWFRRGRECLTCYKRFVTSEVNEKYINELVELRDALYDIKKHSEQYIGESKQASMTLEKLSESLGVLKALKIYKEI